jgi:hypothetical protein
MFGNGKMFGQIWLTDLWELKKGPPDGTQVKSRGSRAYEDEADLLEKQPTGCLAAVVLIQIGGGESLKLKYVFFTNKTCSKSWVSKINSQK